MWMNYFLLLVVVGCYFLGGIFGLYSRSDEREVVEVEVQNKGEWSFQRRDFVRMKAPREQPTTSVERKLSDEILPATADFLTFDCDDETVFPAKNTPPLQASAQNITEIP
ncbi:MAG: hypothetical protein LBR92_00615, partial [Puniceicoccales bacterium]|nr:hypothetical protein [Puniceicoccales bacterium]